MNLIRQIYFRGSLRSCNYRCSYCSFGRKTTVEDTQKDRQSLSHFYEKVSRLAGPLKIMLIPYGEGLIHSYYQESMLQLALLPQIEAVSCQTNLSFSARAFMEKIRNHNVDTRKVKLWASFHPEMVEVDTFIEKIHYLYDSGINLCVGAVGAKNSKEILYVLRRKLNPRIYLFINAKQGKAEPLDKDDLSFFTSIDPLFPFDYKNAKADIRTCRGGKDTIYVNASEKAYPCPRNPLPMGVLIDESPCSKPLCRKERCDCYIAYSNQQNTPLGRMMGTGAFFRIPERRRIEAAFFDVDGTLTDKNGLVPETYYAALKLLADKIPLYLATSLPFISAKRRLGNLFRLFSGGVFADGGHLHYNGQNRYIPLIPISNSKDEACYIKAYEADNIIYKYVIKASTSEDTKRIKEQLGGEIYNIQEKNSFLIIVDAKASKENGLQTICSAMNIGLNNILAIGNTMNDWPMLSVAGYSCAVTDAEKELRQLAHFVLNPDQLICFFSRE